MTEHKEVTVTSRTITCRSCGSTDTSKYGTYKGVQYYVCKRCGRKSAETDAYRRFRYTKDLMVKAVTYYYNGMSYRGISQSFQDLLKITIPRKTLWEWVVKFSALANKYTLTLKPTLSAVWYADETVIDIWGKRYWFWDIIDTDTRFLIATHLSRTRSDGDALKLFQMAKLRSKTAPKIIITDKLHQYNHAFNKTFYSYHPEKSAVHLTSQGMDSPTNINLIERFHGTLKQRTKVMRDLKSTQFARVILDGFVTHYNFFMEHEYLKGKTPAQVAGIGKGIENWGTLIDLSLRMPRENPDVSYGWDKRFGVI